MRVTVEMLKARMACQSQLDLFIELGLDGAEVTEELCVRHAQDFDWYWASANLLSLEQTVAFNRATAKAWKKFDQATAPALEEYEQSTAREREEYERYIVRQREEYERYIVRQREEYDLALAKAFYAASMLTDGGYDE